MKAFIISLSKIPSSIETAQAMIEPLQSYGFDVELFEGSYGDDMPELFAHQGRIFHPTDHNEQPSKANRKTVGFGAMGCFYSHYRLWQKCVDLNEPIWVFEDDVEFIRTYYPVEFNDVLITVLGSWRQMLDVDPYIEPTIEPTALDFSNPCLPGTAGYAITPVGAKKLLKHYANTFTCVDGAMRRSVIEIKYHSHLMGRTLEENEKGNISLTKKRDWLTSGINDK